MKWFYAAGAMFQLAIWISFIPVYFDKEVSTGYQWVTILAQTLIGTLFIYELSMLLKNWGA